MAFDLIRRVQTLGQPRLLVVGDLILDRYIWGDAERISQEAPVPLLRADTREHRLGGAVERGHDARRTGGRRSASSAASAATPRPTTSARCSTIWASTTGT